MQLLPIVIALVLGVSALAFVLYPLYARRFPKTVGSLTLPAEPASEHGQSQGLEDSLLQSLTNTEHVALESEQAARNAIQEVELDYQLGNISESDYLALRERYLRRAVVAMKSRYDSYDSEQERDVERPQ